MSDTWPRRYGYVKDKPAKRASQRNQLRRSFPFFLSVHAIERFHQRVCPEVSFAKARYDLFRLAETARKTAAHTMRGDEIWRATADPAVQFVIRNDRNYALPTCTTVYGPEDTIGGEEP